RSCDHRMPFKFFRRGERAPRLLEPPLPLTHREPRPLHHPVPPRRARVDLPTLHPTQEVLDRLNASPQPLHGHEPTSQPTRQLRVTAPTMQGPGTLEHEPIHAHPTANGYAPRGHPGRRHAEPPLEGHR